MKKNVSKNFVRPTSSNSKLDKKTFLFLVGVVIVYFFFMKTLDKIVNYPFFILYTISGIIFTTLLFFDIKAFLVAFKNLDYLIDKIISAILYSIKNLILSWFLSGIIIIPFNYYDIYVSKFNPSQTLILPIKSLYSRPRNNVIFYEFKGKTMILNGRIKIMDEIFNKKNFKDYELIFVVHPALIDSYVLEDWDIQRKTR